MESLCGKPFLKKDISKIVIEALKIKSLKYATIVTNGLDVNTYDKIKTIIKNVPKNVILNIFLSLDGYPKLHDFIRGNKGNYQKIINLLKKFNLNI